MLTKSFTRICFITFLVTHSGQIEAQIYDSDSLKIEIKYKNGFIVQEYKDIRI
jgi:hypothetical protein